jgi:hypothetical protein
MKKMKFLIEDKVVRYPGVGGWYFVKVNRDISNELKKLSDSDVKKVGWGYIKVRAVIGKTSWTTTLFPQKNGPYLLAIKADVRKKENIEEGDIVRVKLDLDL